MYAVVGTALGSTLTVSMLAIGPVVSQVLFSPGHQRRYTELRSQDCSSCAGGPTVGAMEATETLVWPNPLVFMPRNPIAGKARPISAVGALVVHSDVPQVLNLES